MEFSSSRVQFDWLSSINGNWKGVWISLFGELHVASYRWLRLDIRWMHAMTNSQVADRLQVSLLQLIVVLALSAWRIDRLTRPGVDRLVGIDIFVPPTCASFIESRTTRDRGSTSAAVYDSICVSPTGHTIGHLYKFIGGCNLCKKNE